VNKVGEEKTDFSKEAAPFGNLFRRGSGGSKGGLGTFRITPSDVAIDKGNIETLTAAEIAKNRRDKIKNESTGSLAVDGLLGLTKRLVPRTKEPIQKAKGVVKGTTDTLDRAGGSALTRDNPDSWLGRTFSKVEKEPVANVRDGERTESLYRDVRVPSLLAPVEKTVKFTSPILASAWLFDKMNPEIGEDVNQTPYGNDLYKNSSVTEENNDAIDKTIAENMDKVASLQKIAELEDNLRKYASDLQYLKMEKTAIEKRLDTTLKEKRELEKRAASAEENLLHEKVAFEELRLRTIAQKRSKVAVDLAEQMLEKGLIKQAELQGTIDNLMDCDESTMNMHKNMVKEASGGLESLESLIILGEYKPNDKLATSSDLVNLGLSKSGQSIGEAARDLTK
jgi:hypothetical protein